MAKHTILALVEFDLATQKDGIFEWLSSYILEHIGYFHKYICCTHTVYIYSRNEQEYIIDIYTVHYEKSMHKQMTVCTSLENDLLGIRQ